MRTDHAALNASFFDDDDDITATPAEREEFAAKLHDAVARRMAAKEAGYTVPTEVATDWRENAEVVAIVERFAALAEVADPYDPNSALAVAFRASERFAKIDRTLSKMGEQLDRIANHVQSLPTRDDHDAVVGDIESLRTQLRGLSLQRAS